MPIGVEDKELNIIGYLINITLAAPDGCNEMPH